MLMNYSKLWSEQEDVTDPMIAHPLVASACRREEGRTLFRIVDDATIPHLLIQSPKKPQFDVLRDIGFETKAVNVALKKQDYFFRVRVNPTKTDAEGRRIGIIDPKERDDWFKKMLAINGMIVTDLHDRTEGLLRFSRNNRTIVAYSVFYDGAIVVEDVKKAEALLSNGVGKCKAFGFGLITLRVS